MAFLVQRGKKWYAAWKNAGKNVIKATGISVKGKAEKKLAELTAEAMEATAKQTTNLNNALDAVRKAADTLDLSMRLPSIEDFLNKYTPAGKENNKKNYARAKDRFLSFLKEGKLKRIDSLAPSTCKEFLLNELERVSYGTVKHYKAMLGCALKSAELDNLIPYNPFSRVSLSQLLPAGEKRATEKEPFTKAEMAYMLEHFPKIWKELILTSFLMGGQRIGDVVCLKWTAIDFKNNTILIYTFKTGKKLHMPIHPDLKAILVSKLKNNSKYIFPVEAQRYHRSNGCLSTEFTTMLKEHGILEEQNEVLQGDRRIVSKKSFHSIRHTVVSLLRSSNMFSADVAREIVGHDSEAVERAYFSLDAEIKVDVYNYLVNAIKKEGE